MTENASVPLRQKQVTFYQDEITVVQLQEDGKHVVYVPVRHLCDLLGISYQGQIRRINDDPVLHKYVKGVNVMFTPSGSRGGGMQTTNCLPVDYVSGWLFGINANRVKPEVRDKLIRYQENCHRVLANAFREGELTIDAEVGELLETSTSEAAQAYRMLQALVKMARNQVLMEIRLDQQESRLDVHDEQIAAVGSRLEDIEETLGSPTRQVTPEQAMQISEAVKAVALQLGKRSGRNEYGGVYGELYRRYSINSYKLLPVSRFEEAMNWLNQWLQSLTDSDTPF